ncbi:SAM-dependent methyltransferase [Gordonia hankookensis]|uniref:S-adenosyl-L-methionine-dependent methyltransferase n=1 Tax=Gordonia hankookensis TaxID=589403 RepID=A0ABR7WEX0_9ACTN|nr:SAM-dependent methyltransferase [Gordonia hankookensis]MBD1320279.1 SAM-dependent methyltransferase [Gordonia hankookensis]
MSELDAVGRTALGVAWARATESSRRDALFHDPLAEAIARVRPRPYPAERDSEDSRVEVEAMYLWLVARTLFLDDVLADAAAAGIRQFVILGSGLDGRGFRSGLTPDSRLFEVDRPAVVDVKEAVVAEVGIEPVVDRRPVRCDLVDDWLRALQDNGFRPDEPSAWLAEGLLAYLPADVVTRVIDGVSVAATADSRIGVTVRRARRRAPGRDDPFAEIRALWHDNPDVPAALDAAGWECSLSDTGSVLAAHGRPINRPGMSSASLLAGTRRG